MTHKRVLFIVRYLWGDEGISVYLVRLARELQKHDWEVGLASGMTDDLVGQGAKRGPSWFESQGIKHFYVPFTQENALYNRPFAFINALTRLNHVVSVFQPHVINIHSLSLCPYGNAIRLIRKVPFVSTAHIEPDLDSKAVKLSAKANSYIEDFLGNHFIAISTKMKKIYKDQLGVPLSNISLINHGVDHHYFRPPSSQERECARTSFGLDANAKVACIIGRLDPVKGHNVLFEAISKLRQESIDTFILCAGSGGIHQAEIEALPTQLNISHFVKFLGFTDPRQVLWASDVLVLPSKLEGFGMVVPEAMLCGVVPIRTPAAGALDQIEEGVNGFIVPFDDAEALANRMKTLFQDEALKQKLSRNALDFARNKFTLEVMCRSTIAAYSAAIH